MRSVRRTPLAACLALALALPSLAHAWPAAIQTGTPIRVTAPTLAEAPVTGSFTRHDDSSLTFKPDHARRSTVRFSDITRLEADANPTRISNRSGLAMGAMGALLGFGFGAGIGSMTGNSGASLALGALMAIPGFAIGGITGGLIGGAAATTVREHDWLELPRATWAGEIALTSSARVDSTR